MNYIGKEIDYLYSKKMIILMLDRYVFLCIRKKSHRIKIKRYDIQATDKNIQIPAFVYQMKINFQSAIDLIQTDLNYMYAYNEIKFFLC